MCNELVQVPVVILLLITQIILKNIIQQKLGYTGLNAVVLPLIQVSQLARTPSQTQGCHDDQP